MKYSNSQLQGMAIAVKNARSQAPEKHYQFVMSVSIRTGLTPDKVEERIQEYAAGVFRD